MVVLALLSGSGGGGGLGDLPVPGDILCAALASCTDSTIRVVANMFGIELLELAVDVHAARFGDVEADALQGAFDAVLLDLELEVSEFAASATVAVCSSRGRISASMSLSLKTRS